MLNGPEHRPGFHLSPLGFEHTPKRGLLIISTYLLRLDASLLAWPVPSVLLVVLTMALQRKTTKWDHLLLALLVALLAGYAAYWSESYFLGPRFLFPVIPILVIYIARLPRVLAERVRWPVARSAIALAIPLWLIVTWAAPAKPSQYYGVWRLSSTYQTHGQVAAAILDSVKSSGISNAVVFIPEGWHGRLAARLRALGIRPLLAELIVAQNDACTLQQGLDAVDHATTPPAQRVQRFLALVRKDPPATPIRRPDERGSTGVRAGPRACGELHRGGRTCDVDRRHAGAAAAARGARRGRAAWRQSCLRTRLRPAQRVASRAIRGSALVRSANRV